MIQQAAILNIYETTSQRLHVVERSEKCKYYLNSWKPNIEPSKGNNKITELRDLNR